MEHSNSGLRIQILEGFFPKVNNRSPITIIDLCLYFLDSNIKLTQTTEPIEGTNPKLNVFFDFLIPQDNWDALIANFKVWDISSIGRSFVGEVSLAVMSELLKDPSFSKAEENWYDLDPKAKFPPRINLKMGTIQESQCIINKTLGVEIENDKIVQKDENNKENEKLKVETIENGIEKNLQVEDFDLLALEKDGDLQRSYTNLVDINLDEWEEVQDDSPVINNFSKIEDSSNLIPPQKILGILKLEVLRAVNFRPESDFFLVTAFGAKTFRSKNFKKSFDADWNIFLLLVVRENEKGYIVKFSIYGKSKFSENALISSCSIPMNEIITHKDGFNVQIPFNTKKQDSPSSAHLHIQGKFTPFSEMKKNFWLHLAEDYIDSDHQINKSDLWVLANSVDVAVSEDNIAPLFQKFSTQGDDGDVNILELIDYSNTLSPEHDIFGIILEKLINEGTDDSVRLAASGRQGLTDPSDLVTAGFLTESYARKGWFLRIVNYVANGQYDIGADNANVLVHNRETGHLEEEKMPSYIRLGIRMLYRNKFSKVRKTLDTKIARGFLNNMTIRQGKKFNDPKSKEGIRAFIEFHQLNTDEILEPVESFKNFNQFFYRKLKPGVRKLASEDPRVAVSPADCRMMAFPTVTDATRLWIKGKEFSLKSLLQNKDLANYYKDGSLAIFRLAPQDYHRYHAPVDGILGSFIDIPGTYFTVNPMAIRERDVDVYTDNRRTITTIDSKEFGQVAYVIIGAMLVGSIVITSRPKTSIKRLDEIGYFAFGGSTIICLWKKGAIEFDPDIVVNSKKQLETLVKVGNSIGKSVLSSK